MIAPEIIVSIDPTLRKLAHEAWTDAASMQVLVDKLLEDGWIKHIDAADHGRLVSWYDRFHNAEDDALYRLEAAAREWTCDLYTDLELRVTGGWPDVSFVVWRNSMKGRQADATLHERVELVPGILKQPRLLRAAPQHSGGTGE